MTVLPAEVAVLLPAADAAPRCVDHTREIGVSPVGTGLSVAMIVLVEVPLPWPKPVFAHERLTGLRSMFDTAVGPARLLATHPTQAGPPVRVTCHWRDEGGVRAVELHPTDDADLHECLAELLHVPPDRSRFVASDEPVPARAVLICTQGTHDICCGSEGTRVAGHLELTRPDLRVHRVSHMGGHRFAPTVMTLPDGRMWGGLDADGIESVVGRWGTPGSLAERCRGWWGAAEGAAQAAETAVFGAVGWRLDDLERHIEVSPLDDGHRCVVHANGQQWVVDVTVERLVPTIACRARGGLPAKVAPELRAEIVDQRP